VNHGTHTVRWAGVCESEIVCRVNGFPRAGRAGRLPCRVVRTSPRVKESEREDRCSLQKTCKKNGEKKDSFSQVENCHF